MTLKANNSLHLILEIAKCDISKLKDKDYIRDFLNNMPEKIGMKVIWPAKVVDYDAEDQLDSGCSGTVILAESHCSIHTFPARDMAFLDLFSCSDFNNIEVRDYICEQFNAQVWMEKTVERGKLMEYYKRND